MSEQSNSVYNPHLGMGANNSTKASLENAGVQLPPLSDFPKGNYFAVLFYVLLSSMQIRQSTVMTESKDIDLNASIQNELNNENAAVVFSILPAKAGNPTINEVQTKNQQYAAIRENLQNALITTRQNAEVMMTQTSTNVNLLQQDASENSGWLQTLNTIFQVIDEITQRQ